MKVSIFYEYVKSGKPRTTEVTTEAPSVAAAENTFKNRFAGKFTKVIEAKEVKKPPRV